MDDDIPDDSPKQIPIDDLKTSPEAEDMLSTAAMEPYMNLAMAVMGGKDTTAAIEEIIALPLEKRYSWRVASALMWAFVDFESLNVEADRQTMSPEDRKELVESLKHRPLQLCLFLSTLFGQKQMELMMLSAIKNSRVIAAQSDRHEEQE